MATERRAKERLEFEKELSEKEALRARMEEEQARAREEQEKEEIARLRQEQVRDFRMNCPKTEAGNSDLKGMVHPKI